MDLHEQKLTAARKLAWRGGRSAITADPTPPDVANIPTFCDVACSRISLDSRFPIHSGHIVTDNIPWSSELIQIGACCRTLRWALA